jgi:putative Flp pilus-assembly TadE/G-like protein
MRKLLRKMWNDDRGNALIIAGAALPLLVGSAGLATDTIHWTLWKRELQRAADSAAIAGVYQRLDTKSTEGVADIVDHDLELNHHTGEIGGVALEMEDTYPKVEFPPDDGDKKNQVHVELAVRKVLPFSSLFMSEAPLIRANATAASVPGSDEFCVVSLETNAKNTGILISGNAGISMDCSFMSNSPSANSAYAKGSAEVYAKSVAAVGGIQESNNWHVDSYDPYSPAVTDPFLNVTPAPGDMKCSGHWKTQGGKTTWENDVLDENTNLDDAKDANGNKANCWSSMSVQPSGTLNLPAGTYYISGGDAFIQGNLNCTGCTIVLTNKSTSPTATIGQFKVNSDAKINITAPTGDGDYYKGIAIYQDRRAPSSASTVNKINGNSDSKITGALYFPNQELQYNGTGNTAGTCTLFVSRRIDFSGNSVTLNKFKNASECSGTGIPSVEGGRLVRLVG